MALFILLVLWIVGTVTIAGIVINNSRPLNKKIRAIIKLENDLGDRKDDYYKALQELDVEFPGITYDKPVLDSWPLDPSGAPDKNICRFIGNGSDGGKEGIWIDWKGDRIFLSYKASLRKMKMAGEK